MTATENKRPITLGPPAPASAPASGTQAPRLSVLTRGLAIFALIASALWAVSFVTAQENTTPDSTPTGTPEATPSAQMPRLELELEELNDSGIQGTVTLYEFGDRTIVEFDVEGAGGDHPANISTGVCGDLDPEPAHELTPIDDEGQSLTVVDVRLQELLDEPHAIDMRLAPDQLGTLIACANIEGEPELPAEGTPQATPGVTPTGEGGQVGPTATSTVTATATATTTATATETATATATSPDATAESTPEDGTGGAVSGDEPTATINLPELNDSGVSGTVVLTGQGAATKVSIQLSGVLTGGHIAHLHDGTCATPGEYTYTLTPISAEGTSETVVNLTIEELLGGNYMINVHPSEENWDAWMVCGELVSTGGTVATSTATPTSTPTTAGGQQPTTGTIPVTVVPATTPASTTPGTTTTTTTTTTPIVSGKGTSMTGDGTAGVTGGTTAPGTVGNLPQTAGVGAMLQWPSDPRAAILWATTGAAVILMVAALVIRKGERETSTTHSRWTRLGI